MNLLRAPQTSILEQIRDLFVPHPSFLDYIWTLIRSPFDALISIPALSILAIPAFSSWWTSINLLFFYLTWSTLVLSHSPLRIELLGTLAVRLIFFVLPSLGFLAFDSALPSFANNIKEHGEVALAYSKNESDSGKLWNIIIVSCCNVLGSVVFFQAIIELLFTEVFHIRSAIKITTNIPLPWSIFKGLCAGFLLREILTYITHRYCLHNTTSSASKYHANWQHAIPAPPYSMIAHYDHPIPYMLHVFLPGYLPAIIFRFHLLTYLIYLAAVSLEDTFAYSGYNFLPIGFILGGIARRQERHLMGSKPGNYGCWGLCDFVMRTTLGSDVIENTREEAQANDVSERAKSTVKTARKRNRK